MLQVFAKGLSSLNLQSSPFSLQLYSFACRHYCFYLLHQNSQTQAKKGLAASHFGTFSDMASFKFEVYCFSGRQLQIISFSLSNCVSVENFNCTDFTSFILKRDFECFPSATDSSLSSTLFA